MKNIIRIVFLAFLISTVSCAKNKHDFEEKENTVGVGPLSQELRDLLSQEMTLLQNGMMSIIPAYVSGNWGKIETIAGKMKNSYILKQSLTENQIKELHSSLPHDFIKKDQRFHYLAGMLEHVAKNKKPELINFYFSEMNEACVDCHVSFAKHKFPALTVKEKKDGHGH